MGFFDAIKKSVTREEKTIDDEVAEAYDRMRARRANRDKHKHRRVLAQVIEATTTHARLDMEDE